MSLPDTLSNLRPIDGGFATAIPEDWMQGRTTYGGFSAALALEAARGLAADLPPLRSAQVAFVGPLSGEVEVRARILRRGKNASWASAEITSEAGVGLTATFVFMGAVEQSALHLHQVPPPAGLIPPEQAARFPEGRGPGFGVHFDRAFALPRSEEKLPELDWWVRLKDRDGLDPMVALLLLGDALPPGVMPLMDARAPISSMTWLINLLTPLPATRDGWYLLRSAGNYAEKGCSSQDMAIWNADGEAVAVGMQSIAIFG
ncbi:MAG: acyl-CoA thioesterase [Novosphingobium sp.]